MTATATDRFKISAGRIFGYILYFNALIPITVLTILVLAAFVLGFLLDLRILIVGFMLLCLVAPMLMAWFYFYYALEPKCAFNILPHTLTLSATSVEVQIFANYGEATSKSLQEEAVEENAPEEFHEEEEEIHERIVLLSIPYKEITSCSVFANQIIWRLGKRGMLVVSPEAFSTPEDYQTFIDTIAYAT